MAGIVLIMGRIFVIIDTLLVHGGSGQDSSETVLMQSLPLSRVVVVGSLCSDPRPDQGKLPF